ncbi:MAG: hypothetical protein ACTSVX_04235 [Promethearchaeota archaeon]
MEKKEDLALNGLKYLELAEEFEEQGDFIKAIENYEIAIKQFKKSGFIPERIKEIHDKIEELKNLLEQIRSDDSEMPQVVDSFGIKKDATKLKELEEFKKRKEYENKVRDDAFNLIDIAKEFEYLQEYDKAIENYEEAIKLLNSIGWQEQTKQFEFIIQNLRSKQSELIESKEDKTRRQVDSQLETLLIDKEKVDEIQEKAFNLIEKAKENSRNQKYELALNDLQEAMGLLRSIGIESHDPLIESLIKDINEKVAKEAEVELLQKKRELKTQEIQTIVETKERELEIGSSRSLEELKSRLKGPSEDLERMESKLFEVLDDADKYLKEDKNYDLALRKYETALNLLTQLGEDWAPYKAHIENTILNIKNLKEKDLEEELRIKKDLISRREKELETQEQLTRLIEEEREKLKQKEILIKEQRDDLEYRSKRREHAFKLLEQAGDYIKNGKLDEAILVYQEVGDIFAEIQWTDELPLIKNAILELEKRREELMREQEKKVKNALEMARAEKEFQETIAKQLERERKKLEEKEREVKKKEELKKIREEKEKKAFKLLEDAQGLVEKGNYDDAIKMYKNVKEILTEIQWKEETELIEKAIIEIETKKREEFERKQRELRIKLEKEQIEKEFLQKINKEMKAQREKLKQQEIKLRDKEQELKFRESRKNVAFNLLNKAQELVSLTRFDDAIEIYHEVANIFAEIQWQEEIPVIQQAISELEAKKREKEAWKEKTMKEAIRREISFKQFMGEIKRLRDKEKEKLRKEMELLEKRKELSIEAMKFQEKALKLIEEADVLLSNEEYDKAITNYKNSIKILEKIGWSGDYLRLLKETIDAIKNRKIEKEVEEKKKEELLKKRKQEDMLFKKRIEEALEKERERIKAKKLELKRREINSKEIEENKNKAFGLMDQALKSLNEGDYEKALELYRNAELILSGIQFPTSPIKEMILKIQEKKREKEIVAQKEFERNLRRREEDLALKRRIKKALYEKYLKLKEKERKIKELEKKRREAEINKGVAFDILEQAGQLLKMNNFDDALVLYEKAKNILDDIQYPTDLIVEVINNVKERKRLFEKFKQAELKRKLEKEREEKAFYSKIAEDFKKEKEKLKRKEEELKKKEEIDKQRAKKQQEAFSLLDEAQQRIKDGELEQAIRMYEQVKKIFKDISWESEIPLIDESILELQERIKKQELEEQKKLEEKLRQEEEERKFNELISRKIKDEQSEIAEQEKRIQEEMLREQEILRGRAFNLLDEANIYLQQENFEKALEIYEKVEKIFKEIHWHAEIKIIHEAIEEIKKQKQKLEERKQKELQERIERERKEREFQEYMAELSKKEKERMKAKQMTMLEREKELKFREEQKERAFELLDLAKTLVNEGKIDDAINAYHEVATIFAWIEWDDEIPIIQQAIRELKFKKKEIEEIRRKQLEEAIKRERADKEFMFRIKAKQEQEKRLLKLEKERLEKQKELREKARKLEKEAFELLEEAEKLLNEQDFDKALSNYKKALEIFNSIGWSGEYLKSLRMSMDYIRVKKKEHDARIAEEIELQKKREKEEKEFEAKISSLINLEKEKLKRRKIKLIEREKMLKQAEERKEEAFKIMKEAELLLNGGLLEKSIEKYREAELILREINFPTNVIKETIHLIQERIQEKQIEKQKEFELKLKKEEEKRKFQQIVMDRIAMEREAIKRRQIEIQKQEELMRMKENKKKFAFDLLEKAEQELKAGNYDESIKKYQEAESLLNEIQYPTESLREMIFKVEDLKRKQEIQKQNELLRRIEKEQEETRFRQRLAEYLIQEKKRLQKKKIDLEKREAERKLLEEKRQKAFELLDQAKKMINERDFDGAINFYREASFILHEIHYPIDSVKTMIRKLIKMKSNLELEEQLKKEKELRRIEQEKLLKKLIEERKQQDRERKVIIEKQLREREKKVQERLKYRESAYYLLEKATGYLKTREPDYDKAISLYIKAKDVLAEKIGWEPEIKNLNELIEDLKKEKQKYLEKVKLEEKLLLEKRREYQKFIEEINKKRLEHERLRRIQQEKLMKKEELKQKQEQIKARGLDLIDEGKRLASIKEFNGAREKLREAINKFEEIGWKDHVRYIKAELTNIDELEKKYKEEQERIQKIYQELERRKRLEEKRLQEEEEKLKSAISEVSDMTDQITKLIETQKEVLKKEEEKSKQWLKAEARKYRKKMTKLIKLKQELMEQIKKSREEAQKIKEQREKEREKEKVDEIKRMLKKLSKEKK